MTTDTTAEMVYSLRQNFILARLERLASLRNESATLSGEQLALLKRALYSCYVDCLDAGLAREARDLLALSGNQSATGASTSTDVSRPDGGEPDGAEGGSVSGA